MEVTTALNLNLGLIFVATNLPIESAAEISGDRLLVDKNVFRLRSPRRWEVAVFICPSDKSKPYVKRVVGRPGEQVQLRDGDVWINGELARKTLAEIDSRAAEVSEALAAIDSGSAEARDAALAAEAKAAQALEQAEAELSDAQAELEEARDQLDDAERAVRELAE
jgi:hypothetical protein